MIVGFTGGGSPIHFGGVGRRSAKQKGQMFKCSGNDDHRFNSSQAMKSGWVCTKCGSDLKAKKVKIAEMESLAASLGYSVSKDRS